MSPVSAFLDSTIGRLAVFYVDIICGLISKAAHYDFGGDDD